jgi:hypothetical protein
MLINTCMKTLSESYQEAIVQRDQNPDDESLDSFKWNNREYKLPPYVPKPVKGIWLREEIPIADELLALAPALLEEFLAWHTDFVDGDFTQGVPYINETFDTKIVQSRAEAWKVESLKYTFKEKNIFDLYYRTPEKRARFPTATWLTEKFGDQTPCSSYSILEKNAIIVRHTGIENRDNEYVRIHIPLLVPDGDIFFEVEGTEIDWSDIFAFDNQCIHSAYNYSDKRRLVYLLDVHRSVLGIPIGKKYSKRREDHIPEYVRGNLPKLLHTKQKKPATDQGIWLREDIPMAQSLMELAPKLLEEFLAYHTDFVDGDFVKGKPYINDATPTEHVKSSDDAWKQDGLRYSWPARKFVKNDYLDNDVADRYPTAAALTAQYGNWVGMSSYSILEKDSVINRHTGVENRDNEYVRIHIPLLVPEGDIFFEVEGVEIDWSDIFAFDNQLIHSAHNYSNKRRLVYLFDLHRSLLGLPIGEKYSQEREAACPPFVRGEKPKLLHTIQKETK